MEIGQNVDSGQIAPTVGRNLTHGDVEDERVGDVTGGSPFRGATIAWGLAIVLMVVLRFIALHSDAYRRLSWSSGLYTDEGFYIHNARNLVLFGKLRTDEFNNMLIMPTIHLLQVGVFRVFGVGAVQARMVSVVLSLLTLVIFYRALQIAFGRAAAVFGTLFLGLDHINLLYNRLALMDTPAAFVLVCALYTWVVANARSSDDRCALKSGGGYVWLWATGAILTMAYATRGLAALLVPAPFLMLLGDYRAVGARETGLRCLTIAAGIASVLIPFWILWLSPHRLELARLNHHYISIQLTPHSWREAIHNVQTSLWGHQRGLFPYLFRHSPVQFALALTGCILTISGRIHGVVRPGSFPLAAGPARVHGLRDQARQVVYELLIFWLLAYWAFMTCVNYAPSRYYVIFYPALAALAGVTLSNLSQVHRLLRDRPAAARTAGAILVFLGSVGLLEEIVHPDFRMRLLVALFSGLLSWFIPDLLRGVAGRKSIARMLPIGALMLWSVVNGGWLIHWLTHLTYTQRDADRWLSRNLPPDSTLFGAFAPGLCLDNHFPAVSVIDKLCNYEHPIERQPSGHRYVLILDDVKPWTRWKEPWWVKHYPEIVSARRPIHHFARLGRPIFDVATYAVPPGHP